MTLDIVNQNLELDSEEREIAMLLDEYATDIFDPLESELAPVNETTISLIMKRTRFVRFAAQICAWRQLWMNRLAVTAAMLVAFASFWFVFDNHDASREYGLGDGFRMRGGEPISTMATVDGSEQKKCEKNEERSPLAYLVDIQGSISVSRGGQLEKVASSCELMSDGDVLEMSAGAKAKLMYEDAMFDISGPMHYRVVAPNPIVLDGEKKDSQINPQLTTRGAHLGLGGDNALVIPPVALLAQVIPPTTRAGDAVVQVFSPRGACYGKCPSLGITGDSNSVYEVSVTDMDNNLVVQSVKVRGGATVDGNAVFAAALETDEIYTVRVKLNGKVVNEISASTFWLVGDNERSKIENALNHISTLASTSTKDFFTANVLYSNGCHSEAYILARKLHDNENGNDIYTNLLNLCSGALGIR